jgi:hypothetical protein
MATIRRRQIEAVATIMREQDEALLAYGDETGLTYDEVQHTNRLGWTVDLTPSDDAMPHSGNAALDRQERERRVIRHEGVVLTDAELRRAWDLAQPVEA